MVPQSNVKGEFRHVHHDRLVEALQALKPFAYRINKWILTLPRNLIAAATLTLLRHEEATEEALLDTWKGTEPQISALLQNPSNLHANIQLPVTIMFQIHEKLKTLAAQVPESDRFKIHFVCKCGDIHASYNALRIHRMHEKSCNQKTHGTFVTNAKNPPLYQPHDDAEKKAAHEDAVHTIAWLIRTEMAYFEHAPSTEHMRNGSNAEQMQIYANKLSAELQLHRKCSDECHFLSVLSKDLQQWRSPDLHWRSLKLLPQTGEMPSTVHHSPHADRPFTLKQLHHLGTLHQPDFRPLTRRLQEMSPDGYPCFWCCSQSHQIIGHYLYELMHHLHTEHKEDHSLLGIANRVGSGALSVDWTQFSAAYAGTNIRFILVTQWSKVLRIRYQKALSFHLDAESRAVLHVIGERYRGTAFTSAFPPVDDANCQAVLSKIAIDLETLDNLNHSGHHDIMRLDSGRCSVDTLMIRQSSCLLQY